MQSPASLTGYEQLFRQYYSRLCAYANLFLNDPDAAEDVVQDVFVKLWQNREELAVQTSIQSYLFRAVRNGCLNLIEHLTVRDAYKVSHEQEIRDMETHPVDEAMVTELERRIRETIDLLPEERRKIFLMSRFDGLKYREIADKLDISVKTVENQMYQALRFLRERLVDYLPVILVIFKGLFGDEVNF